jgi:hypothetical protein
VLDLQGWIASIDAMGCQESIANQIIEQKGDYLLAVKNNQPALFEALEISGFALYSCYFINIYILLLRQDYTISLQRLYCHK